MRGRAKCSKQPASDLEIEPALLTREPLEIFVRALPICLGRNVRFGVVVILSSIRVERVAPFRWGCSSLCERHTTQFLGAQVHALPCPREADDARCDSTFDRTSAFICEAHTRTDDRVDAHDLGVHEKIGQEKST